MAINGGSSTPRGITPNNGNVSPNKYSNVAPFGYRKMPFNPMTGCFMPMDRFAHLKMRRFEVLNIFDDVLECVREGFDPYVAGVARAPTVYIAKPQELRVKYLYDASVAPTDPGAPGYIPYPVLYDGVNYEYVSPVERLATDPAELLADEEQIITPDYALRRGGDQGTGSIIEAMYWRTGLVDSESDPEKNVYWIDMNGAARAWAVKLP